MKNSSLKLIKLSLKNQKKFYHKVCVANFHIKTHIYIFKCAKKSNQRQKLFTGENMKKLLSAIFVLFAISQSIFAIPTQYNETHEENWTDLRYYNVPIYKILDSQEAYVIIYAKNAVGVGQCVVPKKWAKYSKDEPRKLQIRALRSAKIKPYLSYMKKDGEFYKVILNVPENKNNSVWGVVASGQQIEGVDKDTLDDLPL